MTELKNFIKYKLIKSVCTYVDESTYMMYFEFYGKQLWKRVLANVECVLGEVLSKIYVDKYFNQEQKTSCINMIN